MNISQEKAVTILATNRQNRVEITEDIKLGIQSLCLVPVLIFTAPAESASVFDFQSFNSYTVLFQ